jgi:hypothetical protein
VDAPHQKQLLKNRQITADRFAVEPDPGPELGVIAELAADLGECGEQLGQRQRGQTGSERMVLRRLIRRLAAANPESGAVQLGI